MARTPILVLSTDIDTGERTVSELHRLGRLSVAVDAKTAAIEMMEAIDFGVVQIDVSTPQDWVVCREVTAAAECPVAVVTSSPATVDIATAPSVWV